MSKSEIKRKCVTNPLEMAKEIERLQAEIERLKKLVEAGYREGWVNSENRISADVNACWLNSDTKKRLEE